MSITKSFKHYLLLLSEIDSVYHEANLKLSISNSYSIILYTICLGGGSCPLQEIKKLSGLNKQTINSSIRNMEKENLVYLEYIDGKSKRISLGYENHGHGKRNYLPVESGGLTEISFHDRRFSCSLKGKNSRTLIYDTVFRQFHLCKAPAFYSPLHCNADFYIGVHHR